MNSRMGRALLAMAASSISRRAPGVAPETGLPGCANQEAREDRAPADRSRPSRMPRAAFLLGLSPMHARSLVPRAVDPHAVVAAEDQGLLGDALAAAGEVEDAVGEAAQEGAVV